MKLNPKVETPRIPKVMIHITEDNYLDIREYIENQVDHFLINSESWILSLFKKLPRTPSPGAAHDLEELINAYLSTRDIRELNAKFQEDPGNHKPCDTDPTRKTPHH